MLQDAFSAVPRVSGLIFIFCAPGLIFGGTEGVGSGFQVLRSRTNFRYRRTSLPPKMGPGAPNMITVPGALRTTHNGSESVKYENMTRRPRYGRKRVRERKTRKLDLAPSVPPKTGPGAQNMKSGPDTLGTVKNGSWSVKHENGTRRPMYR
jgi:hypothetical protein